MDIIRMTRDLGKAIQEDERYIAYNNAKIKNDSDEALQELIGEFNLKRQNLNMEMNKSADEKDKEKLAELNNEIRSLYEEVMSNESMAEFTIAKNEIDKLIGEINAIITMSVNGQDPETAEISCGGACGTCGGCG